MKHHHSFNPQKVLFCQLIWFVIILEEDVTGDNQIYMVYITTNEDNIRNSIWIFYINVLKLGISS